MTAELADREDRLDAIIADYLKAISAGIAPSRNEFLAQHPEFEEDLATFLDDRAVVEQAAAPLRRAASISERFTLPRVFGRYHLVEELGRGGMGVVYRAEDPLLNREVAVKILPQGPLASDEDRLRFRLEAEAIARLGYHPHVVSILDVGTAEGHPYLAMQWVDGPTLQDLKTHFCGHPAEIAGLLATLADAVQHAHTRGIAHRDLKPSNILMARSSDPTVASRAVEFIPVVSDFGLARLYSRDAAERATLSGTILGTPAYMAPEQAQGGETTLSADIYSLGVILYELLTGQTPHRGTPLEILRKVSEEDPIPPRQIDRHIPRDLEIICLKCLRKTPEERYASARELAEDLRRYLNGDPVRAASLSALERGWRWVRRQPVLAALWATLTLVLLGSTLTVLGLWLHAEAERGRAESNRHLAEDARELARREAKQAEDSFALAHEVVRDFCLRVAEDSERDGGLHPDMRRQLERATGYYNRFLQRHENNTSLRDELSSTQELVGRLHLALGDRPRAVAAWRESLRLTEALQAEEPGEIRWMRRLVGSHINLGTVQASTEATADHLEQALLWTDRFLEVYPDDLDLRSGKGHALANLGAMWERRGERRTAEACYTQASELLRELSQHYPQRESFQRDLAFALINLGSLLSHNPDKLPLAVEAFAEARLLRERLFRASPADPRRQADLAHCLHNQAVTLREAREPVRAREGFAQALQLRQVLADRNPNVVRYQADLAATIKQVGFNFFSEGNRPAALEQYQRAAKIYENLVLVAPEDPAIRRDLGLMLFSLGSLHGAMNNREEERQAFERARLPLDWLLTRDTRNVDTHYHLARVLHNLAFNQYVTRKNDLAITTLNEALGHSRQAMDRAPEHLPFRNLVDLHFLLLAEIHWKANRPVESLRAVRERQALWPENGPRLYHSAREVARLFGVTDRTEEQTELLWSELERAFQRCKQAGFQQWDRVEQESEWTQVRETMRFRDLLKRLR